jgi:hypothetical protein
MALLARATSVQHSHEFVRWYVLALGPGALFMLRPEKWDFHSIRIAQ